MHGKLSLSPLTPLPLMRISVGMGNSAEREPKVITLCFFFFLLNNEDYFCFEQCLTKISILLFVFF